MFFFSSTQQSMLKEAGKEELEAVEIQSSVEEEYAGKYSTALNDLRDALELEKQIITKIRNGMTMASLVSFKSLGHGDTDVKGCLNIPWYFPFYSLRLV